MMLMETFAQGHFTIAPTGELLILVLSTSAFNHKKISYLYIMFESHDNHIR
jgi:hypothetical protein